MIATIAATGINAVIFLVGALGCAYAGSVLQIVVNRTPWASQNSAVVLC